MLEPLIKCRFTYMSCDLLRYRLLVSPFWLIFVLTLDCRHRSVMSINKTRKSRRALQNKVRLKVFPEQLTLFVNTSVTFKKCIIQYFCIIPS